MKAKTISTLFALIALGSVCLLPVSATSCATKANVTEGSEAFVVNAEQSQIMAFAAVDAFLTYEHDNRDALWQISPEIKRAADKLRSSFPDINATYLTVLKKYKDNRTPENKADLNTWLAVLEQSRFEAYKWLAEASKQR